MDGIEFEWEPRKAAANRAKHKVSFEEAATAFEDEQALVIDDPEHSKSEDRFILLGMSRFPRLLVVVHCFREMDQKVRIISARKATRHEQSQYLKHD
jgi:uncharacterized DUF497 family protein